VISLLQGFDPNSRVSWQFPAAKFAYLSLPVSAFSRFSRPTIFNGIDDAEQVLLAVRNMRYRRERILKYPDPPGLRGKRDG